MKPSHLIVTFFVLAAYSILGGHSCCQGENNNWFGASGGGITFNTPDQEPEFVFAKNNIRFLEAFCTVSDAEGNLLFYCSGEAIGNRNHKTMMNGDSLHGRLSTSQGSLILPFPTKEDFYYVFTMGVGTVHGKDIDGLYFSEVDMTKDDGLGAVTKNKNIFLQPRLAEKMVAIPGGCDNLWLIVQDRKSKEYFSYNIDEKGISPPVVSRIWQDTAFNFSFQGKLIASPDGSKIAETTGMRRFNVLSFDKYSGKLSDGHQFRNEEAGIYSACFSSNNRFLYTAGFRPEVVLSQFDMSLLGSNDFYDKKYDQVLYAKGVHYYDIHRGVNEKIYLPIRSDSFLTSIESPNLLGSDCNVILKSLKIPEGIYLGLGIHNQVVTTAAAISIPPAFQNDTTVCIGEDIVLSAAAKDVQYEWQDGSIDPTFTIENEGTYWVERSRGVCTYDRDSIEVIFTPYFTKSIFNSICEGDSISFGSKNITASGFYQDTVISNNGLCDTILYLDLLVESRLKSDTLFVQLNSDEDFEYKGNVYTESGFYIVTIPSVDVCDSIIYLDIRKSNSADASYIYIPNVFSPNGDNQNDKLIISTDQSVQNYSLNIYDRYGQKVWISSDIRKSWDGRIFNNRVANGVFIVHINYRLENSSKLYSQVEAVTIVR